MDEFDVLGAFKTWKAMDENDTDLKVKTLQSNNGREYVNVEFQRYLYENGIMMRRTMLGNP